MFGLRSVGPPLERLKQMKPSSERLPSMLGPSGVTPAETRKSPNLQPVIGLHSAKAAQRSSPASPSSGPPRSTTLRMGFLMYPSPLPSTKEGGPPQSHRVAQRRRV